MPKESLVRVIKGLAVSAILLFVIYRVTVCWKCIGCKGSFSKKKRKYVSNETMKKSVKLSRVTKIALCVFTRNDHYHENISVNFISFPTYLAF